jgi:energy-coupling factor transporter ATP-binding protein EcfA2
LGTIDVIEIDQLFGRYSYHLNAPEATDSKQRRLMLIYGDNGAGKTTVLKLIWHLLSPHSSKGHRSYIAQTPFRKLALRFSSGISITAEKVDGLVGPFRLAVNQTRNRVLVDIAYHTAADFTIKSDMIQDLLTEEEAVEVGGRRVIVRRARGDESYVSFLSSAKVAPLYLADDRRLHSDLLSDSTQKTTIYDEYMRRGGVALYETLEAELSPSVTLESSIQGASEVLRRLALGGQRSGTLNAHNVYVDVLKQLSRRQSQSDAETYARLVERLKMLGLRNDHFAEFDLVPQFDSSAFLAALGKIPRTRQQLAINVVEPFVDSLESRLEALQDSERLTREFLQQANKFLRDKAVFFRTGEGITVRTTKDETRLTGASLSSGERHLLLLLCSTLIARDHSNLFIIDEPELSLNVKWQRSVLQSLLRLTEGTNVQFIAASHSIEMITRNKPSLIRLEEQA